MPPALQVPLGAAGLYLLGRVYRLVGRLQDAKEQYARALRLNPLLWSAYEELCSLGELKQIPPTLFQCSALLVPHNCLKTIPCENLSVEGPACGGGGWDVCPCDAGPSSLYTIFLLHRMA